MPPDIAPAVAAAGEAPQPIEDAQRFQTGGVITVSAAHAVHDTYTAFLSPLLPLIIANLSLTKSLAGLLTVFVQGPSLLQPFIGRLADRVDLRILVILGPTLTAAMLSLVGIAPNYGVLALLLLVAGFSSAGLHSVGPVIGGKLSGRSLGRGMSFWMVGGEIGRTIGPIIATAAVTLLTPRGLPALMFGGLAASLLIYLRLRNAPDYRPPAASSMEWRAAVGQIRPVLLAVTGLITFRALLASVMTTFLPTFLTEQGSALWLAGASLSVMEAAGVVGALLGGSLSDRLGRRNVMVVMSLVAPLAALFFPGAQGWQRVAVLLVTGFSLLSTTPVLMAVVQERAVNSRALANGIFMAINFVITSLAVVAAGALGDWLGLRTTFYIAAITMLASLPFALMLPKHR